MGAGWVCVPKCVHYAPCYVYTMPLVMFTLYNMLCIHYVPSYVSTDPTSVGLGGGGGGGGGGGVGGGVGGGGGGGRKK